MRTSPDLVVIEAYVTSANRAYRYADHYRRKGAYVCLGGLHPTSLPEEAARHADSVFCGPGEDTWPAFLKDFRVGRPKPLYRSTVRTLAGMPRPRRDLIKRERYLVPNSLVVSRGCPHAATSATKRRSSAAGSRSTCRRSTTPSPRSTGSPAVTSTSSTTTSSAARRSPRRFSTACAAWAACGSRPGRCRPC